MLNRLLLRGLSPLLLLVVALPAWAAAVLGQVAQVQAPAWLEHEGARRALAPGMQVVSGDRITTGANARVYLDLADGSRLKLGEFANFAMTSPSTAPQRLLQGVFDLAKGAFRFTTNALRGAKRQRDVRINVGTATIGIRGTDVWGKAADNRELVALIEGNIELARPGGAVPIHAMQVMNAMPGGEHQVVSLSPELLTRLAAQTEIARGNGATAPKGARGVMVTLGEHATQAEALASYDAIQATGHAASIRVHGAGEGARYEVRLGPYASDDDARVAAVAAQVASGRNARILK